MANPLTTNPAAANSGIPAVVYLHAAQPWAVPPNGNPGNPMDHTWFHPNEQLWSAHRLPVILGQLEPYNSWLFSSTRPIPNLIENGVAVLDGNGANVRDFWFLPRYLASWTFLEPWRGEAYFRMDRRLTYRDLWARMLPGTEYRLHNSFNNNRSRHVRNPLNMVAWEYRQVASRAMVEVLERLTAHQLAHNTSWDVLPQGIAQPLGNARYPGRRSSGLLPFDYFIPGHANIHFPSRRLAESLNELFRLQGLDHWSSLDPSFHNPSWWTRMRTSGVGAPPTPAVLAAQGAQVIPSVPATLAIPGSVVQPISQPNVPDLGQSQSPYQRDNTGRLGNLFLDSPGPSPANIGSMVLRNHSEAEHWDRYLELFEAWWDHDTSVDAEFLSWIELRSLEEYGRYLGAGGNLEWMVWYRFYARDQRTAGLAAIMGQPN